MAEYNGKELTAELIERARACKTADELLALAEENGISITGEEAQAYLEELSAPELVLSDDVLDRVAGGKACYAVGTCYTNI